jgi:uncharacterized protein YbjT (DUF2867 family)
MILVIGGTGTVGGAVVKQLADKKAKTRVLVRNSQKEAEVKKLGLETAQGDVTKPDTLGAALKGVERLFLLTPASPQQADQEMAVVDLAKRAGVQHVVLLSAVGVSADSPLALARNHARSEEHLKKSGLAWTILQPHSFMQNLLNQAGGVKTQGALYGNFKDGKVAMVDARDIAAVAVAALTEPGHEGKTYVITGGEAVDYIQVAQKLSAVTGKKVNYVDVPSAGLVQSMTSMGVPDWLAGDLAKLGEVFAAGHGAATTDVVEKVAKKKPNTVDQFLKDYAPAFKG